MHSAPGFFQHFHLFEDAGRSRRRNLRVCDPRFCPSKTGECYLLAPDRAAGSISLRSLSKYPPLIREPRRFVVW
ncbi:hypothetical protein D3C81_2061350 [compost metagenome]